MIDARYLVKRYGSTMAASPPWPEEGPLTRLSRGSGAAG
jgi:hypothetical protein